MEIRKNTYHEYLRDGEKKLFNQLVAKLNDPIDLENCNLQGIDLRGVNLKKANLQNSYLKNADLRGVDLSNALMDGASIHRARIGGALFPINLEPAEIRLSLDFGTRMRIRKVT